MPTPKSKRDVILKTSVAAGAVSELSLTMDATFTTDLTGTGITYEDESGKRDEKTLYKLVFADPRQSPVGAVTIRFVGDPQSDVGATVEKIRAGYTMDPPGRVGNVRLIDAPAASYERIWKQDVRDRSRTEIVDNVAKVDVRVIAEAGYSVRQTVTSTDPNRLVLSYQWNNSDGRGVVTGTVSLDANATASEGFTLGNVRITDSNSDGTTTRIR